MDSRTVVGDRSRCIARAMRRIALLWCTSAIRSVTRARRSPLLLSLSLSLPLSRGSRAAAPKLPEIIGFFCFPVIRRMALRRSMSFLPVPVTLCSHIRSFVAFPPSSRSQFPPLAPLLSLTTPPRLLPPWTCS